MNYITRQEQTEDRPVEPFIPFSRPPLIGLLSNQHGPSDALLDGVPIQNKSNAARWIEENEVHTAISLSNRITSTRPFLGCQTIAVRNDIKHVSHVIAVEPDAIVTTTLKLTNVVGRTTIPTSDTRRAHLFINKFSGEVHVLHASGVSGGIGLWLDGEHIPTESTNVDFPYFQFSQAPIGHVQMDEPPFGVATYKCRTTGGLYIRTFKNGKFDTERALPAPPCVGGVDFAVNGDKLLLRIDAIVAGKIQPMTATSNDGGATITAFAPLDLGAFAPDSIEPSCSPVIRDFLGNFHVPINARKGGKRHLINVIPGEAVVDALVFSKSGYGFTSAPFPKNPNLAASALGRGDGRTDGLGIIATGLEEGKLFVSNSQAGGIYFPPERYLNYDMPKAFCFRATECCYTRGQAPNLVSMDYVFIEMDDEGHPLSQNLWFETWDMPLPYPQITAVAQNDVIELTIHADAWFEQGKTTFTLNDPRISILETEISSGRDAKIRSNSQQLKGTAITFEMKSNFYWHEASTTIQ